MTKGAVSMRRGQSATEYALFVTVAAAAVIGCQVLIKRVVQAKLKLVADDVLALTEADGTDPDLMKRGEKTQLEGLDTQDPGSGLFGSEITSSLTISQDDHLTEKRKTGGTTTQSGFTLSSRTAFSSFKDESDVPPNFALRTSAFERLGGDLSKLPVAFTRPKPPINDRPPDTTEPPITGPTEPGAPQQPPGGS